MKKLLYLFLVLGLMMTGCIGYSRHETMRAGLDSINERNRNDLPFTVSDVQPYVDYFDDNGSPNDQMLAYYMLGSALRNEGNIPEALKYFRIATELADTTDEGCDYRTLSRVYGQIAVLFHMQRSPRLEIEVRKKAISNAWKAKDTIAAIIFYENMYSPYHMLNKIDSVLYYSQSAASMFKEIGRTDLAARSLGSVIDVYLRQKDYNNAKSAMDEYEQNSLFFDQSGNIEKGKESYYNYKGMYYEGVHRMDSAEYFYRKLLYTHPDLNTKEAAYKGLLSIYRQMNIGDSVAKYAELYCQMNDSASFAHSADEITRMQAIYDYTRHQQIADTEARNAERARHYVFVISLCCVVLFVCLYAAYARYKRNKHAEIKHIKEQYENDVEKLEQAKYDLMKMQEKEITHLIEEKAKDICQLQQQIGQYEQALSSTKTVQQLEHHLEANGGYARFRYLSSHPSEKPTEEDWQLLRTMTDELLPDFKTTIYGAAPGLKQADYDICLLVRLYFSPSEVAMLTDNALSAITMKRRRLLERLFHQSGKAETFDRLIRQIR